MNPVVDTQSKVLPLCECTVADKCPLGRIGFQERCTVEDLRQALLRALKPSEGTPRTEAEIKWFTEGYKCGLTALTEKQKCGGR